MGKIFLFIFIFILQSSLSFSQLCIQQFAKDYDALPIDHLQLAKYQVKSIQFVEKIDSTSFPKQALPPDPVKWILHSANYDFDGLPQHYEWSFYNKDIVIQKDSDAASGQFFIVNEYEFKYDHLDLKEIQCSDQSLMEKITYETKGDSLVQKIFSYQKDGTLSAKCYSVLKNTIFSPALNVKKNHTSLKQFFYPQLRILELGVINPNSLHLNHIPANSFLFEKFEQKRFLMEIYPGLWIFFEISG